MKFVKKSHVFAAACFVFALLCAGSFSVAGYFCSSLQIGFVQNFSSQAVGRESKVFLVVLAKSQSKLEAETLAKDFESGGGYVWSDENYHFVVHCAKERENDAVLVKSSLEECGTAAQILTVTMPPFVVDEAFSPEGLGAINDAIASFFSAFRALDDMAVGLQTNVYTYADCEQKLQKLTENCTKTSEKFAQNFSSSENLKIVEIADYLGDLLECVMLAPVEVRGLFFKSVEILDIYRFMASDLGV